MNAECKMTVKKEGKKEKDKTRKIKSVIITLYTIHNLE